MPIVLALLQLLRAMFKKPHKGSHASAGADEDEREGEGARHVKGEGRLQEYAHGGDGIL